MFKSIFGNKIRVTDEADSLARILFIILGNMTQVVFGEQLELTLLIFTPNYAISEMSTRVCIGSRDFICWVHRSWKNFHKWTTLDILMMGSLKVCRQGFRPAVLPQLSDFNHSAVKMKGSNFNRRFHEKYTTHRKQTFFKQGFDNTFY